MTEKIFNKIKPAVLLYAVVKIIKPVRVCVIITTGNFDEYMRGSFICFYFKNVIIK